MAFGLNKLNQNIDKTKNQLHMMNSAFRKTSQSMYQPGNNRSVLGNSKFNGTLEGSGLMGKSTLPGSMKKIEGQDFMGGSKSTFQEKINKLKSKPDKKVLEEEYIKGLQQEIKFLEYELKLLKDKEIIEREGVNELDNFLKDEIPINQNILAMKNKYNATKNKLEEQFKLLTEKNAEAGDVLKTQKNEIDRLHQMIDGHRKQVDGRGNQFKEKLSLLVRQLTLTADESAVLIQHNKLLQQKIRSMTQQTATIQRGIEKEKVLEVRAIEQKTKMTDKFDEKAKKTKEDMLESLQKVQDIEQYQTQKGTNPLVDELMIKNSILRKKIMLNQKQISTSDNIIDEIKLFLDDEERQREVQRKEKLKVTNQIEEIRGELQNLERNAENMIKEQTLRTKKIMVKEMTYDLREKEEIYQKLVDRLSYLEQACSNLISDKKDLQDSLQAEENKEKQLLKLIKQLQLEILESKCSSESFVRLNKEIEQQIVPLKNELQKCTDRIPMVEAEIEKKNIMINHLNKQVDLLKELKGLDLDHLHMISTSGAQMQNTLHQFIKNWEKLKSL